MRQVNDGGDKYYLLKAIVSVDDIQNKMYVTLDGSYLFKNDLALLDIIYMLLEDKLNTLTDTLHISRVKALVVSIMQNECEPIIDRLYRRFKISNDYENNMKGILEPF
ncbi:hypothetical protein [Vallitalea sp.]|jgi:hypothetical protein|uniref:hypothetical protein n=1 Tax=Vallitalea sp. TaxID=1882829 RepID=UPI0025F52BF9|nr:hypothetical protein [Vallitalea sp.]MCT4686587.1 hypothetical protein [Vallitalea sp.]